MSQTWQLQEAKNKFSNLVERAQQEGPQIVTKHGKAAVVVLSVDDYKKITKNLGKTWSVPDWHWRTPRPRVHTQRPT